VQPCNAVPNHGFTVLGWLYGQDFGDKLCKAVNCGFDTDCTGATLGSLLGILGGTSYIPQRWSGPVGTSIKLHPLTRPCGAPTTLQELADRTMAVAERLVRQTSAAVSFGEQTRTGPALKSLLFRNDEAYGCLQEDLRSAVVADEDLEIILYYNGEPVMCPGISRMLDVECRQNGFPVEAEVELELPDGWSVLDEDVAAVETRFEVEAVRVADTNSIGVRAFLNGRTHHGRFTMLGPGAAQGFPSATNVEYCPTCHGRKGSCLCT